MFEELLGMLGRGIDIVIWDVAVWNRKRFWYKLYAYCFITTKIRAGHFKDDKHFNKFMEITKDKFLWNWQHKRLIKMYKGVQHE